MELNLDWEKRSDLVYAPENRKMPRILKEDEIAEAEVELTHPKAPEWLKRHKKSTTTVHHCTRKTDPKNPRRYKRLSSKMEKLTPRTVQINKGSLLRRSGVSFRSATEESRVEKGNDANTPWPSKPRESKSNARHTEKGNSTMKRAQTDSEERKKKKRRVLERSEEESDEENENERTKFSQDVKATTTTATENQAS